ncbi:hypothetical protein M8C21_032481 [Ambrosia artemisiifolia]|uniref:Uncharacterized protein n=1 Tax=Ambrosia artemisiifolia TaxID=4212 RepID=A0AAD5BNM3_AMBAR|nr:hypothetical protein M8C21_032481 [Ambrosia artemisiifolia]
MGCLFFACGEVFASPTSICSRTFFNLERPTSITHKPSYVVSSSDKWDFKFQ